MIKIKLYNEKVSHTLLTEDEMETVLTNFDEAIKSQYPLSMYVDEYYTPSQVLAFSTIDRETLGLKYQAEIDEKVMKAVEDEYEEVWIETDYYYDSYTNKRVYL